MRVTEQPALPQFRTVKAPKRELKVRQKVLMYVMLYGYVAHELLFQRNPEALGSIFSDLSYEFHKLATHKEHVHISVKGQPLHIQLQQNYADTITKSWVGHDR